LVEAKFITLRTLNVEPVAVCWGLDLPSELAVREVLRKVAQLHRQRRRLLEVRVERGRDLAADPRKIRRQTLGEVAALHRADDAEEFVRVELTG
jgi:hypothetical protein